MSSGRFFVKKPAVLWRNEPPSVILSRPDPGIECEYIIDIVLMNSNILRTNQLETGYAR